MSDTGDLALHPRLAPGVRLRRDEVRNAWVLLAPERILTMNGTAVEILALCDGTASLGTIADRLAEKFGGERDRIESDASALLRDLARKGLVLL